MLCVADCVIRRIIPEPTEWQRIGNQIDATFIFTRSDFVNVGVLHCDWLAERWRRRLTIIPPVLSDRSTLYDLTQMRDHSHLFRQRRLAQKPAMERVQAARMAVEADFAEG
jgi:hypothetical protein